MLQGVKQQSIILRDVNYPKSGERNVAYRGSMYGHNLEHGSSLRVIVHTDRDYDQVGTTEVAEDHTWSYSPLYIGGSADKIWVQATFPDGSVTERTITDVRP